MGHHRMSLGFTRFFFANQAFLGFHKVSNGVLFLGGLTGFEQFFIVSLLFFKCNFTVFRYLLDSVEIIG